MKDIAATDTTADAQGSSTPIYADAVGRVMARLGCRESKKRRTFRGPRVSWCIEHNGHTWGPAGCPVAVAIVTQDVPAPFGVAELAARVQLWRLSAAAYREVASRGGQEDAAEYAAKAGIADSAADDVTDLLAGRTPGAGRWVYAIERRLGL